MGGSTLWWRLPPFFYLNSTFAVYNKKVPEECLDFVPPWKQRGPANKIPSWYIPQAQWEMYVTDTRQNYFVSNSALQGTHVFIVARDDRYVQLMLTLVSV